LYAARTKITDDGSKGKHLPNMQILDVSSTEVTDSGIKSMKCLQILYSRNTEITIKIQRK
jgi:hypothetical protein